MNKCVKAADFVTQVPALFIYFFISLLTAFRNPSAVAAATKNIISFDTVPLKECSPWQQRRVLINSTEKA
jgi:hypothetical protein